MEESQQVIELGSLSHSQYLEQIEKVLRDRPVLNMCIFVTFKPEPGRPPEDDPPSEEQQRRELVNGIKDNELKALALDKYLKNPKPAPSVPLKPSLLDEVGPVYEQGDYSQVIEMLLPRSRLLEAKLQSLVQNKTPLLQAQVSEYNNATFYIGNSYFRMKDFPNALDFYLKFMGEEPMKQRAQRMNNLGSCYAIKKSYQLALKYYNEANRIYNDCPEEDSSNLLNNIALIYLKCEMYRNAEEYFVRSIEERKLKSMNNKSMLFNSYVNLGTCRRLMGKYEDSLNTLYIAYNYSESSSNRMEALSEICKNYELQEKWSEALTNYERLSEEYERVKRPQGPIYERVSNIHVKMGNQILAKKFAKNAIREYQMAGDERKMSEITNSVVAKLSVSD